MNKEVLGVRRRALEEEYFAKVNRALIARIREAEASVSEFADANSKAAGEGLLKPERSGAVCRLSTKRARGRTHDCASRLEQSW